MLKSSAFLMAFSTNSLPRTDLRMSNPLSNSSLFMFYQLSVISYQLSVISCQALPLDLHAGPLFDDSGNHREVRIGAVFRLRNGQHLTDGRTDNHRHAK